MKRYSLKTVLPFAVLAMCGAALWAVQLASGLGITGMNNVSSWGLYITNFMFFVGLSAGGLIVSSAATVFNISSFKAVAKPAIVCSTICICLAAAFVLVDLGSIAKIYNIFISPNFASPLVWDMCIITCYIIVNIVYLWLMLSSKHHDGAKKVCSWIALPVAILVHSVTAWIFGLEIARTSWNSAIMAPLFVASALDSGLGLLILSLLISNKVGIFPTSKELIADLSGLMIVCCAVDGFMVLCEILTMGYNGAESEVFFMLTQGAAAPFFWFELCAGVLLPCCALAARKRRLNSAWVVVGSMLIVAGVFCKRVWLLFAGLLNPNIADAPGITLGKYSGSADSLVMPDFWSVAGTYAPTPIEIGIVIGLICLGIAAYQCLANLALSKQEQKA